MRLDISTRLSAELLQTLSVMMTPQMLQMLRLLHLPYQELVESIAKEAEENVMLEVERTDALLSFLRGIGSDASWKNQSSGEGEETIQHLAQVKGREESLTEVLTTQLDVAGLPPDETEVGKRLIENLDERGYLPDYPELREKIQAELDVSAGKVDKVLQVIQTFEPEGVGARTLKECLLIQIREYEFENAELQNVLERAVRECLDHLGAGRLEKAAKILNIPVEGVSALADFIKKNLNPDPGARFGDRSRPVIPSFMVEKPDGGAAIKVTNLEQRYGPVLKVNGEYLKILDNPKTDAKTREFLRARLEAAKQFIEHVRKRHETISQIVEIIARTQSEFFEKGAGWLKPLLQKNIAEQLSVHPSTISRAVSEKYIATPQGVYSLKTLCPREWKGYTATQIKSILAKLVTDENSRSPLSDEEIRDALRREGIPIERRTVAAYRQQIHIASSFERRRKGKS